MRFAARFVDKYGGQFLHVHGIGWHQWDSIRWIACDDGAHYRALETLIVAGYEQMHKLDAVERKKLFKDIQLVESSNGARGALELASNFHPCTIAGARMDQSTYLFNATNGTLDLQTGNLRESDPFDYATMAAGTPFDPEATSPLWTSFLTTILPDEDVRAFVQRLVGYAMLGEVREHVMPIWTGTGANGKGTLRDALLAAYGDYGREVGPEILMQTHHPQHRTFLMQLRGRRLVFCSETDRDRRFAEATMKRLVGGDPIEANLMRKDPIVFAPTHTLIMCTNHLPLVSGDDPAVWRRILVVPFDVVIPESERDPELPKKLSRPAERAAVLAWAWRGYQEYQQVGLAPPAAVRARTEGYQADSDTLGRFLADEVSFAGALSVTSRALYERYQLWCREQGETPASKTGLGKGLRERDITSAKDRTGQMVYRGLGLMARDDETADRWR